MGKAAKQRPPRKKGGPRHCCRCPGKPLLAECMHTLKGKAYLAAERPVPGPPPPLAVSAGLVTTSTPVQGSEEISLPPSSIFACNFGTVQALVPIGNTQESNSDVFDPQTSPTPYRDNIDPQLLAQSPTDNLNGDNDLDEVSDNHSRENTASASLPVTPSKSRRAKRVRPSANDALFGLVEGAGKGNATYKLPRTCKLRPPLDDIAKASKHFRRLMANIVQRCEAISIETGCWLYIGAQHVTVVSPITYYASPRLCREALKELNSFHNQFNRTTVALVAARHEEAKTLALNLAAVQDQLADATRQTDNIRNMLLEQRASEAIKDALISRLQNVIASNT